MTHADGSGGGTVFQHCLSAFPDDISTSPGSFHAVLFIAVQCARWPIRPIPGFWGGSKVHKNLRFPALDADEPPSKI